MGFNSILIVMESRTVNPLLSFKIVLHGISGLLKGL